MGSGLESEVGRRRLIEKNSDDKRLEQEKTERTEKKGFSLLSPPVQVFLTGIRSHPNPNEQEPNSSGQQTTKARGIHRRERRA